VKLYKNGEPFKMSKRAGTFVTLRDVVEEVGADVTRFVMLTRKNDATLDFDFDKVLEQSKDNPVFYVQYANARAASVLRKARDLGVDISDAALAGADLAQLDHEAELALMRKLAEWPALSNSRPARKSRTALPPICPNWPPNSMVCGTGAMMCPRCASCKRAIWQQLPQNLRLSVLQALRFLRVLLSWG
jgi:hypothetical protein